VGVLLLAAAGAILVHRALSQGLLDRSEQSAEYSIRYMALKTLQRILFPVSMLLGVLAGQALLLYLDKPVGLLNLAVPLLTSLTIIRIAIYSLRKTFRPGPVVKAWENIIATSVWIVVALHLLGWLPAVLQGLDGVAMKMGDTRVSLLATIKLVLAISLMWVLALWLARLIENHISRAAMSIPEFRWRWSSSAQARPAGAGLPGGA